MCHGVFWRCIKFMVAIIPDRKKIQCTEYGYIYIQKCDTVYKFVCERLPYPAEL